MNKHTFAICAYQESPYLEACIQSVLPQRGESDVIVCTSTPNESIRSLCTRYDLPLYVNPAASSIHGDWNFAMSRADSEYVTLCHQDDVYEPGYAAAMKKAMDNGGFELFFTDYYELRGTEKTTKGKLLVIKRILQWPLRFHCLQTRPFAKRWSLRFGNGICCPSVTYHKAVLPMPLFQAGLKSNLDWQTWERLSHGRERFCYCPQPLMCHRIHDGSETSRVIGASLRTGEDEQMFRLFWPRGIAKVLAKCYSTSEKSNDLSAT